MTEFSTLESTELKTKKESSKLSEMYFVNLEREMNNQNGSGIFNYPTEGRKEKSNVSKILAFNQELHKEPND